MSLDSVIFTDHALWEMTRRGISEAAVRAVLAAPAQVLPVRDGRVVAQGIVAGPEFSARYLVRVVIDVNRLPPEVVTVYRTSKIAKYQRPP